MNKLALACLLAAFPLIAFAEGGCPPGSYPIGGQGVQGCAPIPSGGSVGSSQGPVATGKWETRWGAISEDSVNLSTGASVSKKSKRLAISAAKAECERLGGNNCKLRLTYYNQCVALADPDARQLQSGGGRSSIVTAVTVEQAAAMALDRCAGLDGGQTCEVVYTGCSMSEFKMF